MSDPQDQALREDVQEEAKRLLEGVTPEPLKFTRYGHGGARLYRDGDAGERQLVADFFDEGNREFYYAAPRLVRSLLAHVESLSRRCAELEQELKQPARTGCDVCLEERRHTTKFVERCRDIRNGSPNAFYAHVDAYCKKVEAAESALAARLQQDKEQQTATRGVSFPEGAHGDPTAG